MKILLEGHAEVSGFCDDQAAIEQMKKRLRKHPFCLEYQKKRKGRLMHTLKYCAAFKILGYQHGYEA